MVVFILNLFIILSLKDICKPSNSCNRNSLDMDTKANARETSNTSTNHPKNGANHQHLVKRKGPRSWPSGVICLNLH